MANNNNNIIILESSDGKIFEVERDVAVHSKMIQLMIEDDYHGSVIPLSIVTSAMLSKVLEYCERHSGRPSSSSSSVFSGAESGITEVFSSSSSSSSVLAINTSANTKSVVNEASSSSSASPSSSAPVDAVDGGGNEASSSSYSVFGNLKKFDEEYMKMDWDMLIGVLQAANYLEINSLLELAFQAAADYIADITVEEVRQLFHIQNDFTPEEEAEIRRKYAWVYQD